MYKTKLLEKEDIIFIYNLMSEPNNICALHTDMISWEEWQNILLENDTDEENFIAYKNDVPCAWLKLNGLQNKNTAWISMLVVSEKFKQQGVGTFAVGFAVDYLTKRGFKQVKLHTTADNLIARKLYEKCGFSLTKECSSQLTMCKEV